jgi:putative colanic acid biosynthesis acetyltransferase WcaF
MGNCLQPIYLLKSNPIFFYRRYILNLFGAVIALEVNVYPLVKIWFPSNLKMDTGSSVGHNVYIFNQGSISIGERSIISQGAHLCASTHDYNNPLHPIVLKTIVIGKNV